MIDRQGEEQKNRLERTSRKAATDGQNRGTQYHEDRKLPADEIHTLLRGKRQKLQHYRKCQCVSVSPF